MISGRPKEKRLGLLKALNDAVVSAARISPDDLMITLYETAGENISFGRGLAQRAHVADDRLDQLVTFATTHNWHHPVGPISRQFVDQLVAPSLRMRRPEDRQIKHAG